MRWLKIFAIAVALLIAAAAVAAWLAYRDYQQFLSQPLTLTSGAGANAAAQTLHVAAGSGVNQLAAELERRGLLSKPWYLKLYARLHPEAAAIRAGEYRLEPPLTAPQLLAKLTAGDVLQYSLTIPEGWTFRQLRGALRKHPQLLQTVANADDQQIMAALGEPDRHPEGLFFPDTYHFPSGTTDLAFLQRARASLQRELNAAWEQRRSDGKLMLQSPYELLIMASIIERETGQSGERDKISGVFNRRLQINMRLQTDPTVIYGMGDAFDGNIRRRDLRRDTPYNTYTRHGLPPTPIALPGRAALQAAGNPLDGSALYFVATGDGGHAFADSLAAHNRNVRRYQLKQN